MLKLELGRGSRLSLWLLALRTALSTVALFSLALNLLWWVPRTRLLARVLGGEILTLSFTHLVPALWLWFTLVIGLLVIAPLVAIWLGWRLSVPLAIVSVGILWLITFAVQRWGDGFFPLVPGAGGYYIRIIPFGE